MYARSVDFPGQAERLEAGIAYIRDEAMPQIMAHEGCVGLSCITEPSGRCIVTTAWSSKDTMHRSGEVFQPLRDRAGDLLGGRPQVDEWEIGAFHRDHSSGEGACVRCTWTRGAPEDTDRMVSTFRSSTVPMIEQLPGFVSASLLVDRDRGLGVVTTTYQDSAALEASRAGADQVRAHAAEELDVEIIAVAEFDLMIAHLRVPELV